MISLRAKGTNLKPLKLPRDTHPPGKLAVQQVGIATDGSGKHTEPAYANRSKGRKSPERIHRPGTESKPSGRTITK